MIKLFDIENGKVVPSVHCFTISYLRAIMDNYPETHVKIYAYLYYMTCSNPDENPYFNIEEDVKEELILRDIEADFLPDDELIQTALENCKRMYDTPTFRAYRGIKTMLDRLAAYMETTSITDGRDGNINSLISAAKNYEAIRISFKGAYKDLKDEQQARARGGAGLAYDQAL